MFYSTSMKISPAEQAQFVSRFSGERSTKQAWNTRHARRRKAPKKNKHTKQNTKPYLFLPLPWSHVSRTPRSLLSCFRSPVKRQKLKPVLQANESYVVNVNAEITTYPSNSYKGCLTEAYFLKCCFLKSFTTRNSTCYKQTSISAGNFKVDSDME